jgi:hypothetical protein
VEFFIEPYKGIGKIELGMTRDEIEEAMGEIPRRFKKFHDDNYETDAFDYFYVYYRENYICEAIELISPAKVMFNEMNLMELSYIDIEKFFLDIDEDAEPDDSGLTSYKYGIAVYAPSALDKPSEKIEAVLIFEKGYYDDINK